MTVILDYDMRIFGFYFFHKTAQSGRTANAGHVFQRYLVGAEFNQFVYQAHIVFHRVDGRMGDA